jgi:deoxyribodipyrimidine photo-lyase
VLFTRDLRVRDNPALAVACEQADLVVPLFVVDGRLMSAAPNRGRFLLESLADLRESLRARGGDLTVRHGSAEAEVIQLATETGAQMVFVAGDVSRYAARRQTALARECARHRLELRVSLGVTVVPPGELRPAGGDHYKVFTPYWHAWRESRWRRPSAVPHAVRLPPGVRTGELPVPRGGVSPFLQPGGETAGSQQARAWLDGALCGYADGHDDLAGARTSRLSAYLRFGCLSPLELAHLARRRPSGEEFVRQLAWRDFFYQVTAAFPDLARAPYRPREQRWRQDQDAFEAWRAGRTGIPIVDAGLRQLAAEGYMHNRARLIAAHFLTRILQIDWRLGYRHFFALLADGDVASNAGNWQWAAGTGNNPRPGGTMNMLRQARRFDPSGDYVRRYLPELAGLNSADIHMPWRVPPPLRRQLRYPQRITGLAPLSPSPRPLSQMRACTSRPGLVFGWWQELVAQRVAEPALVLGIAPSPDAHKPPEDVARNVDPHDIDGGGAVQARPETALLEEGVPMMVAPPRRSFSGAPQVMKLLIRCRGRPEYFVHTGIQFVRRRATRPAA